MSAAPRLIFLGESSTYSLGWRDMGDGTEALIERHTEIRPDPAGDSRIESDREVVVMRRATTPKDRHDQ